MSKSNQAVYLIFCSLIGAATWMLCYGLILQLLFKDGRILRVTVTSNPFAPFQQLILYSESRPLQVAALGALMPALAMAVAAAFFGLSRRPANPLGDAAFQDAASLRQGKWFRKDGHIFGRYGRHILRRGDDRHHLIIGPTRSGKGVGYVIPNALMHPGSMIVTDLKGEIYQHTAAYRKRAGHLIYLFSPGSAKTHRWNPLDFVRSDRGNRTMDIQNMASILIPETVGSENAVWQGTAQQVIAGLISYVLESQHYKNRRNLGEVNSFLNSGTDLQVLMKLIQAKEPNLSKFTAESFNAYISLNERAARSALLDIQKAMQPFRNDRVTAATDVTDIDLEAMQRRPVSIYLAPNITEITILRPLLTLFVQQIMDLLTRQHDANALPVYFLLDEFRQLKRMDEIMNKLPYVAGYNIKIAFIIQDLKNLDEIYGETSRHSLLGNCGLQIMFGANDQATAEYVSRALGKKTIRYISESRSLELMGLPRRTKVEQIRERDLLMPQEVRQMPEDRMVLLVEGQRPIFGRKLKFHEVEPFASAVRYSLEQVPEVPEVDYIVARTVPALAPGYDRHSDSVILLDPTDQIKEAPIPAPSDRYPDVVARTIRPKRKNSKPGGNAHSRFAELQQVVTSVHDRIAEAEDRLTPSGERLMKIVGQKLDEKRVSAPRRKMIGDILRQTIPDPVEPGPEIG